MDDHQSDDIFNPPATEQDKSIMDHIVELLLGGFRRWDSIYFIHIAEHGYTYENTLAFFPALPMLTRAGMVVMHYKIFFRLWPSYLS